MNAKEIMQALDEAVAPLGRDARASIVIASRGTPTLYVSAETHWRAGSDKMVLNTAKTFEEAIEQVRAWVADAPMRNRVVCAEDLGLEAA